jgi:TolA-binding protein
MLTVSKEIPMSGHELSNRLSRASGLVLIPATALSLFVFGCGSGEETTEEWETTPVVSMTARLEYRIDSLMNENRRLKQQIDALATENRSLTARAAELEMKLDEAMAAPPPPPAPEPITNMNSAYQSALSQYRQRDFAGAKERFEALLASGISDNLADNCHYWIGECSYGMGRYSEAIQHFEMVRGYRHSEKKDAAQLMIGNSYSAMGNKSAARDAYNKLISSYPASPYVKRAEEKLARLP